MSSTTEDLARHAIDSLVMTLDALQPSSDRAIATQFASLYPSIEQALSRGVTQRAVMEALKDAGLKLHPAKFKTLLEEARALREENGDIVRCHTCGNIHSPHASAKLDFVEGDEK